MLLIILSLKNTGDHSLTIYEIICALNLFHFNVFLLKSKSIHVYKTNKFDKHKNKNKMLD